MSGNGQDMREITAGDLQMVIEILRQVSMPYNTSAPLIGRLLAAQPASVASRLCRTETLPDAEPVCVEG